MDGGERGAKEAGRWTSEVVVAVPDEEDDEC